MTDQASSGLEVDLRMTAAVPDADWTRLMVPSDCRVPGMGAISHRPRSSGAAEASWL